MTPRQPCGVGECLEFNVLAEMSVYVFAHALQHPRRDMILVVAAGPAINIVLAVIAGLLFHGVPYLPDTAAQWLADNLRNALLLNG